ncbi:metallo-beta-lactamase superfamily protein [Bisporella sp. PMI_857]|nr:metallo-beta-lactamase superfamily protein [Bisporella sp. PMI_857]
MGASRLQKLPRQSPGTESYISITPFDTGRMVTPSNTVVEAARGASMATSWRFFLKHEKSGTCLWFDMGISHDLTNYPPAIQKVHAHFKPTPAKNSIEDDTLSMGVSPSKVQHIIVSHAHWDHVHPVPSAFTSATMLVGPGTLAHTTHSHPKSPTSKFDGRIWDASLRSFPLKELPPANDTTAWQPLGPFPSAHDFFGDGSLYILNATGHMPGNLAALIRVKTKHGEERWVLLGGDCAHCNLFTYWPEAPFGRMPEKLFPSGCLHEDPVKARETIQRIAECKRIEGRGLMVWFAHGEFLEGLWDL